MTTIDNKGNQTEEVLSRIGIYKAQRIRYLQRLSNNAYNVMQLINLSRGEIGRLILKHNHYPKTKQKEGNET